MGIVVNTNVSSSLVQRSLTQANKEVERAMVRISYGQTMKAVEDAAGLSISESLRSQVRGSDVAMDNAQTGINLLQTAESGLGSVNDNLQRIRELTVQAANGTNGEPEREAIRAEIESLTSEIDRTAESSSFSQVKLLNGDSNSLSLQIGANANPEENSLDIGSSLESTKTGDLGIPTGAALRTALSSPENAAQLLNNIDSAISTVNERRSDIGAFQNRLESTVDSLQVTSENLRASESRIRDVDIAKEISKMTQNQVLQNSSTSLLAQANQNPYVALSLLP